MDDKYKPLIYVVSIVATVLVTHFVTKAISTVEEGSQALDDAHIRQVIQNEFDNKMTADIDGETMTYGQALSKISSDVTKLATTLEILVEE